MTTRIEAAVKAWDHHWGDRYGDEALEEMGDEVKVALDAADAHDAAHGIHRLELTDATVERAARAMCESVWKLPNAWALSSDISKDSYRIHARAVLATAVEARQ